MALIVAVILGKQAVNETDMSDTTKTHSELLEDIQQLHSELAAIKQTSEEQTTELNKSEERFSLAMRGANDGLWDWNLETDEVYYSPRWKSMLGYEEHELVSHLSTWANLVHPDDKSATLAKARDYLEGRTDSFETEFRMRHKEGHDIYILSQAFLLAHNSDKKPTRLVGTHIDISERVKARIFDEKQSEILEMIAVGKPADDIYDAIALLYEGRHPGMRCSMLELDGNILLHGGAPSLPEEYCKAVHGLENGPNVGSCGTSTYTGKRVLVEDIATDPKWKKIKDAALKHDLHCCWSEPVKSTSGKVLGAFGMYYKHPALPNKHQLKDLVSAAHLTSIVMERDQTQKRILDLAYTDELTGLASRAHFYQHLKELIKTANRHKRRFALLYIDLDDFKSVNDSLGHDAGDHLLKTIAERLLSTCREIDFVARLSGDEFCILVEEVNDDYAANVAQRCLTTISKPVEIATRKLTPACSIGIAHFPDDGNDFSSLIKAADTSLYAAKGQGKNQYAFYEPELTRKAEYRFQVEQYLRDAIEKEQLSLVYQTQVDVNTHAVIGVEALSRWYHPQLGQVSPADFIPIAERIGMIKPLTEWVLKAACHQAIAWKNSGLAPVRMSVNISPTHFLDKELVTLVKHVLSETGVAAEYLELEVTEGVVQTDEENLCIFKELKNVGVKLAIDDFGTGYSSFASLKHLNVDNLKIDKYFIGDMMIDEETITLVSSMVEIGHKLGHSIIAEGVETEEQLAILKELGCQSAQGYLFSKPVSGCEIVELLK